MKALAEVTEGGEVGDNLLRPALGERLASDCKIRKVPA